MLEIKNLAVGYRSSPTFDFSDVSFNTGELTSIIGANGCGKSTLLKAIVGILPAKRGDIFLNGEALSSLKRSEVAKKIAYLPQGRSIPDMTVMQMTLHGRFPYVGYPRRYTEEDRRIAYSALERLGISELADKSLCELSGGMRQTAYIAMALAQDTEYILLDEPTVYLDIANQIKLMKLLRRLADEGKGIVTVTHDIPTAFELSDKITVIDKGRAVMQATPQEASLNFAVKEIFGVGIKYSAEEKRFFYDYSV